MISKEKYSNLHNDFKKYKNPEYVYRYSAKKSWTEQEETRAKRRWIFIDLAHRHNPKEEAKNKQILTYP